MNFVFDCVFFWFEVSDYLQFSLTFGISVNGIYVGVLNVGLMGGLKYIETLLVMH